MQKINANENIRLIEAAEAIANGTPVSEAANSTGSESIFSGSADASYTGLAFAPATPALALAR